MSSYEKLEALAWNLWWSWNPEVLDLFARLDSDTFHQSKNNPIAVLNRVGRDEITDAALIADIDTAHDALDAYMNRTTEYAVAPRTSYFCMEYGIHESLPIYSGGLGVLAGDHSKEASDLGIPFTAIGLFLREGYFRQHFTEDGWQQETHPILDPELHPLTLVTDDEGLPVIATVWVGQEPLRLRAWHVRLGRTNMYLLDSDFDRNPEALRSLTTRLYQGDRRVRLQQEIILGIGGLRLLRMLGVKTDVFHMNEGHCALLALELLRERLDAGDPPEVAERWVRDHAVFTTHTPVMAGHDRFDPQLFLEQMSYFQNRVRLSDHDLLSFGRVRPDDPEESFTMTVLGLKLSRAANGVSELNGMVAREQWHVLYPERAVDDVPIDHVTNGVHLATWTVPIARAFLNEKIGNWKDHASDPSFWSKFEHIPDEVLWQYRSELRRGLVAFATKYVKRQSLPIVCDLDPEALTIGFARRFATYKRAPLLFTDLERVAELFGQRDRPVQVLFAGKAHPADEGGKRFIQRIVEASHHPKLNGRVVFLENYDMEVGRMLVSGCDVWLNNPRRPMEASGTSGQKIAVHGGLNLSILDGWWPEGYNGSNGWSIGSTGTDALEPDEQDDSDAESLYQTLERSVVPAFYERDDRGVPSLWINRMRSAMIELPGKFSAERMLIDYVRNYYTRTAEHQMQTTDGSRRGLLSNR